MEFLIVTGLSGSGKSQAINALEDIGYYCIDNIPLELLESFFDLCAHSAKSGKFVAGIDIRSFLKFSDNITLEKRLLDKKAQLKILYLDCKDEVLITRYEQTRRMHPVLENGSAENLSQAVAFEREILSSVRSMSDYIIDTSKSTPTQLKEQLISLFVKESKGGMHIELLSFGFKHTAPADADIMFDVRCLPNPHYVDELNPLTGMDRQVSDYVFSFEEAQGLYLKILDYLKFSIPLYKREGKSRLVIVIGCTGGKHRSVAFCEKLAEDLKEDNILVKINHRDTMQ